MTSLATRLNCPLCGQVHEPVPLAPGERALCARCDTVLARRSRWGSDAPLAFALTGLLLAVPALVLPFVSAGKFGQIREGVLLTGVEGLWANRMPLLGTWVLLCGLVVPIAVLIVLTVELSRVRFAGGAPSDTVLRAARGLGYWAMPEVQLLAVLVALTKLGSLVDVTIGAGFWCYIAMSLALLMAWRSYLLQPAESAMATREATS